MILTTFYEQNSNLLVLHQPGISQTKSWAEFTTTFRLKSAHFFWVELIIINAHYSFP